MTERLITHSSFVKREITLSSDVSIQEGFWHVPVIPRPGIGRASKPAISVPTICFPPHHCLYFLQLSTILHHLLHLFLFLILRQLWNCLQCTDENFLHQCFNRARSAIAFVLSVIFPSTSLLFPAYFCTASSCLLSAFLTYVRDSYFLEMTTSWILFRQAKQLSRSLFCFLS